MLVVAHKAVAKAEGRVVALADVEPGERARALAAEHGKDPRLVELILAESAEIVRADAGRFICRTRHGFVCANAGVDQSNAGGLERAVLLPRDPDASARALRAALGCAVVVADSFGRAWRVGQAEVAIGCAGLLPSTTGAGAPTPAAGELHATQIAIADEAAAAADLVRGKATGEPAVRIRGPRALRARRGRPGRRRPRPRPRPGPVRLARSRPGGADAARLPTAASRGDRRAAALLVVRAHRAAHVEALARGLDVLAVRERPRAERAQRRGQRGAERRERVVDARRHLGVHLAADEPSRSIPRSVWVSTFSEIGVRSPSSSW